MQQRTFHKFLILAGTFLGVWFGFRFLFPIALPFLLGTALAFASEPMVNFGCNRLRMPRGLSVGIGVSLTFLLTGSVLVVLAALLMHQLGALGGILPNLEDTVNDGMTLLENWLLSLIRTTPEGIRSILSGTVTKFFAGGTVFLDRVNQWLLGIAASLLHGLPDSALGFGTMVLASFMISAKLPLLRTYFREKLPSVWRNRYLPALSNLKTVLLSWLKAQAKLAGITFLIVTAGLIALQVPYAPLWALGVAAVDALPLLGTGTALVPWSLVCFLQHNQVQAIGLLGIYAAAALTRSALEPKLLGKQLGLDPLMTLIALYAGYRIWGVGGMILSPLLAVIAVRLGESRL